MHSLYRKSVAFYITYNQSLTLYRCVRNASKRLEVLKTLKDFKVKNATEVEDFDSFVDYKDLEKRIKENDLDVEEAFTKGEDWQTVAFESSKYISEGRERNLSAKKQLIGRKYFKDKKETNLLTHAAKQQIRYLYNLNPVDWTPETLAQSFPTSVAGVKKLLKSNFVLPPEKIKEHDEDVRRKWEILMSGESSEDISFYTQCLWNEGKLLRENYNGNPNLPHVVNSAPQKITKVIKQNTVGEYAAIVQKYVEYKAQKESSESCNSELIVKSEKVKSRSEKLKPDKEIPNIKKKSKLIIDNENNNTGRKEKQFDEVELPFNQFKENLRQELSFKSHRSPTSKQYHQWIEQDFKENDTQNSKRPFALEEFSSEIPKYNKEGIEVKRDKSHKNNSFYMYNDKLGYQYPMGKTVKGKIRLPAGLQKKNSVYKVGQCVYDEDGEFLYKIPC